MENFLKNVSSFVDSKRDEIINFWESVVNTDSFCNDKDSVNSMAEIFKTAFENEGVECQLIPSEPNGCTLTGIWGLDRKGDPIIFSGHMDTVFKLGTTKERPFTIKDGKAFGPGVLDMKGGIVIALYVIKALKHIGYTERPIKILFSGDEEIGHVKSNGAKVLSDFAKGGLCAFNMETGLVDNSLCTGRKGRLGCDIVIKGVESHAGNDFTSGKNAIEEACFKVLQARELTNEKTGTTCAATVIIGGKITNSIPKECTISLDIRFEQINEVENVKKSLETICSKSSIKGTSAELIYTSEMMPYETTKDVLRLHEFVNFVATEHNFAKMGNKTLGGSSDASYLTMAKVPTLCSCGVKGQWNHTSDEYALVESMFERINLWTTVVFNLNRF